MPMKNVTTAALQQAATIPTAVSVPSKAATVATSAWAKDSVPTAIKLNRWMTRGHIPISSSCTNTSTKYRDNSMAMLPFHVDVRCNDHLVHVASSLCPELLSTTSSDNQQAATSSTSITHVTQPEMTMEGHTSDRPISQDTTQIPAHITVRPLTGGLSNELFIVENVLTNIKVLVRINPTTTGGPDIVERDVENELSAWLSTLGDAPIYYGRFENGRVEEFYDNHVTLDHPQMKLYAPHVAQLLANFHSHIPPLHMFPEPSDNNLGGSIWQRGDTWLSMAKDGFVRKPLTTSDQSVDLFVQELEQEWNWLKLNLLSRIAKTNATNSINESELPTEDDESITMLARQFCAQIVLTHMDCQPLNILKPEDATTSPVTTPSTLIAKLPSESKSLMMLFSPSSDSEPEIDDIDTSSDSICCSLSDNSCEDDCHDDEHYDYVNYDNTSDDTTNSMRLRLIDYEYAGLNPRAVDIANTFCEFCSMSNLQADYENEYPPDNVQDEFLISYLDSIVRSPVGTGAPHWSGPGNTTQRMLQVWADDDTVAIDAGRKMSMNKYLLLGALKSEIGQYTLISHLTWAIWSIVQLNNSSIIGYDYFAYAKERMEGYQYFRKRFWEE